MRDYAVVCDCWRWWQWVSMARCVHAHFTQWHVLFAASWWWQAAWGLIELGLTRNTDWRDGMLLQMESALCVLVALDLYCVAFIAFIMLHLTVWTFLAWDCCLSWIRKSSVSWIFVMHWNGRGHLRKVDHILQPDVHVQSSSLPRISSCSHLRPPCKSPSKYEIHLGVAEWSR